VNSPWDDGICLKASYGLGKIRHCENITISDCYLAGNFDEGTLLDATFKRSAPEYQSYRTGRIKLGTESNGDFKNIAITNCVFDDSRGIAIESVDGAHIEDVAISNITMRHVANSPIFIRLGSRLRGPGNPPVGTIRRITVDNLVASDADWDLGSVISGIPGHPIEDLRFSNLRIVQQGGGPKELGERMPPEEERSYPVLRLLLPSRPWPRDAPGEGRLRQARGSACHRAGRRAGRLVRPPRPPARPGRDPVIRPARGPGFLPHRQPWPRRHPPGGTGRPREILIPASASTRNRTPL
jgi:hypothetical protein